MIITRTPLRISFVGGGTDYPVSSNQNGGAVLSTAIDKYRYTTCRRMPPFFGYRSRVSYSKVENVANNEAIEHPSVRGCLQFLKIREGVEIHHVADLPARTGPGDKFRVHCWPSAWTLCPSRSHGRSGSNYKVACIQLSDE
jgi:D-glycero-alpha-D-manno-heptose-7-phosphate kinase